MGVKKTRFIILFVILLVMFSGVVFAWEAKAQFYDDNKLESHKIDHAVDSLSGQCMDIGGDSGDKINSFKFHGPGTDGTWETDSTNAYLILYEHSGCPSDAPWIIFGPPYCYIAYLRAYGDNKECNKQTRCVYDNGNKWDEGWEDKISSSFIGNRDSKSIICANTGHEWIDKGGSNNCCDGGEDITRNSHRLCYNGNMYSCDSGTTNHYGTPGGSHYCIPPSPGSSNFVWSNNINRIAEYIEGVCEGSTINGLWLSSETQGGQCCGNNLNGVYYQAVADDGRLSINIPYQGTQVCAKENNQWTWTFAGEAGKSEKIYNVEDGTYNVVSNGINWFACDAADNGTENFLTISGGIEKQDSETIMNKRFICYKNETYTTTGTITTLTGIVEQFGECSWDGTSTQPEGGKVYTLGQSLLADNQLYFCTIDNQWISDLDTTDIDTCENAITPQQDQLSWTGSLCCGDDPTDTYNDKNWEHLSSYETGTNIGGCFNNLRVESDQAVGNTNLIKNGDLSQGTGSTIPSWIKTQGVARIPTGTGELRLSGEGRVHQDISRYVMRDEEYTLSSYIRLSEPGTAKISILKNSTQEIAFINSSAADSTELGEQTITITFTSPADFNKLEIFVEVIGSNARAYFDNIELFFAEKGIMNYDGEFYGCKLTESERVEYYDIQYNEDLIPQARNFQTDCEILESHFCSPDGEWESPNTIYDLETSTDLDRDIAKVIHPDFYVNFTGSPSSCCPEDYCWDGFQCIPPETDVDPDNPIMVGSNLYLCTAGEWKKTVPQCDWNVKIENIQDTESEDYQTYCGYCGSEIQCLVDRNGNSDNNNDPSKYGGIGDSNNPQCINNTQTVGDHLCDNGEWTTRTKQIAGELLDFVAGNSFDEYTLFCDNYKQSLVDFKYHETAEDDYLRGDLSQSAIPALKQEAEYACPGSAFECVNNFCVLKYKDGNQHKTIFGTSLNSEIDDQHHSILNAIDEDRELCNNVQDNQDFTRCNTIKPVYYSTLLNAIIFSQEEFTIQPQNAFITFFKNPIQSLINLITGQPISADPNVEQDLNFTKATKNYNKIFVSRKASQSILGIVEKPDPEFEYMLINYENLQNIDICQSAERYAATHPTTIGTTNCETEGNTQYVISYQPNVIETWQYFTSMIRLN